MKAGRVCACAVIAGLSGGACAPTNPYVSDRIRMDQLEQRALEALKRGVHYDALPSVRAQAIESLQEKGAVITDETGNKLCRAVPPQEVLQQLESTFSRQKRDAVTRGRRRLHQGGVHGRLELGEPERRDRGRRRPGAVRLLRAVR